MFIYNNNANELIGLENNISIIFMNDLGERGLAIIKKNAIQKYNISND